MKTSLLNDIDSWANKYALEVKEVKLTTRFVIISINNYSVTSAELKALEEDIRNWLEEANWHSVDHTCNGLEIWVSI